jgi:NTE family protein
MGNQAETEVVFLRCHPGWKPRRTFITSLAASLQRQTGRAAVELPLAELSRERLDRQGNPTWILIAVDACRDLPEMADFPALHGHLIGPGDAVPAEGESSQFVVQMAERPTLPALDAHHRLIHDAVESKLPSRRFLRTVDSVARGIAGTQVGVALGGGAALGWAHIGVLEVLENAGIPVDVLAGCSMGGAIGALYASGRSIRELTEIANHWKDRTRHFVEWQFWRMSLISERQVKNVFARYFGNRLVNHTEIPFWANTLDMETGREFAIRGGRLVDCVRAAVASPGLLHPVRAGERVLVDAALVDPVPTGLAKAMGSDFTIAVNALPPDAPVQDRLRFRAWQSISRSICLAGKRISEAPAVQYADILLEPDLARIGLLDFSRAPELIERGRRSAQEHLPWILASYNRRKRMALPAANGLMRHGKYKRWQA